MKNATTVLTGNRSERKETRSSRLAIQHRPVDTLRLDPLNPREHSKKQIAQVAESIRAFGFNVPVLIDDDSKIIAGHGRVLACQLLGITEVPTICLSYVIGGLPPFPAAARGGRPMRSACWCAHTSLSFTCCSSAIPDTISP